MNIKNKIFLSIGTIALVATLGFGANTMFNRNVESTKTPEIFVVNPVTNTVTTPVETATTPTTTTPSAVVVSSNIYKDGTYTATASYSVPRASNTISINVTISGDIVTNVTATHKYSDSQSGMYVDSFDSAISSKVVGQSVGSINLSRVGGASLTTIGFNQALTSVIANAAA